MFRNLTYLLPLAILPLPAWAADVGIPYGTAFSLPFLVNGKGVTAQAIVVDPGAGPALSVFYGDGMTVGCVQYGLIRKDGPQPGPIPNPSPNPNPQPTPNPMPGPLHCLFLYESEALGKMPLEQVAILTSKPLREYLSSHCAKEAGKPTSRFLDKDTDPTKLAADWRQTLERGKEKPMPWMIVTNGKNLLESPWPASAAKMIEALQGLGGK